MGIAVLMLNSILTVKVGGISGKRYTKLMLIPLAFILIGTLAIIVNFSTYQLDAFAVPIGKWYMTGSWNGLLKGSQLIVTALAAISCLYFLSLNTTMTDIIEINRKLHIPELMIELMVLIYRYIFVLLDIAYSISTAQDARLGNRDYKTSMKSFGSMVQVLFIRSMKRARCLYDAMEARCYEGTIHVLSENRPMSKKNVIMIIIVELILLSYTLLIKIYGNGGML
jgi:cobalt ABC transporter, permease protein CbiQ